VVTAVAEDGPIGAAIGETIARMVFAGINASRKAKAKRAAREVLAASQRAAAREQERRQAWLTAVMEQMSRGSAGDATMEDVRRARRNPLDDRRF
jgi:hypothetical protein